MSNADLVDYYLDLLILQYRGKPNAMAIMRVFLEAMVFFETIIAVENGYDINTAVGAQQDLLGKILGIDRVITGTAFDRTYFGLMRYGENPATSQFGRFARYGTPLDNQFLRYGEIRESRFSLNDVEFRNALVFKAAQNVSSHSVAEIDNLLFDFYGNDVVMDDNFDMTMTFSFPASEQRLALILQSENLLPRPAGVEALLTFT